MMMIGDERREVAAKLRANAALGPNALFDLHEAVGDATYTQTGLLNCIADLIDPPTCRNLALKPADEFLCSRCGEHVDIAYVEKTDDYHAKSCPKCSAKVVD